MGAQSGVDPGRSVLLHARDQVAVEVERDRDAGVPGPLARTFGCTPAASRWLMTQCLRRMLACLSTPSVGENLIGYFKPADDDA